MVCHVYIVLKYYKLQWTIKFSSFTVNFAFRFNTDGGQIDLTEKSHYLTQDLVDNIIIQPRVFLKNLKTNPKIGRLPLETGLTFSFTLPPIPPSVSDLIIEKAKALWGLDLKVWVFNFLFRIFPSNFCQLFLIFFTLKM